MARLGRPDIGLVTAGELVDATAQITDRIAIPLIVDGDTGLGHALTLQRLVRHLERAGAAAVPVEVPSFPKRCGPRDGKRVVPPGAEVGPLPAPVAARHTERAPRTTKE